MDFIEAAGIYFEIKKKIILLTATLMNCILFLFDSFSSFIHLSASLPVRIANDKKNTRNIFIHME